METMILSMNDVLRDWKKRYDIFAAVFHEFSVMNGTVFFGTFPLCPVCPDMKLENAEFDADSIDFHLGGKRMIQLQIEWPEDAAPIVAAVAFLYRLVDTDAIIG